MDFAYQHMVTSLLNQLRSFSERNDQHGGETVTIRMPTRNVKGLCVVLGANDVQKCVVEKFGESIRCSFNKREKVLSPVLKLMKMKLAVFKSG
jgi:hypothetical protein